MRTTLTIVGLTAVAVAAIVVFAPGALPWRQPTLATQLAAADGKEYYRFEAGYHCRGFAPGPAVASWKGHVDVRDGRLVDWGDRCNNQGLPVAAARAATATFSADLATLTLYGEVFRVSADPAAEAGRP